MNKSKDVKDDGKIYLVFPGVPYNKEKNSAPIPLLFLSRACKDLLGFARLPGWAPG
jgi:hypothetical protein